MTHSSSPSPQAPGATPDVGPVAALVSPGARVLVFAAALAGAAGLLAGIALEPKRALSALLAAGFVAIAVSLGALAWSAIFFVSKAGFWVAFKRVMEAMASLLWVGALCLVGVLANLARVYPWASHEGAADPLVAAKSAFLNPTAFLIRFVLIICTWAAFAYFLRRSSLRQDQDGAVGHTRTSVALSAVFLLVGGYTLSLASVDWLMSTDPHWASNIYGYYTIGSVLLAGVAGTLLVVLRLRAAGALPQVNDSHLHDLGKLLFGLSTFWAYLWFSQFLLIWYANLPEETAWINVRLHGGWAVLFWGNVVVSWVLPFVLLLAKPAKRSTGMLAWVGGVALAGRFLDVWLQVAPSGLPERPLVPWIEACAVLVVGAAWVLALDRALSAAPLVAKHDPYLGEALHHHQ